MVQGCLGVWVHILLGVFENKGHLGALLVNSETQFAELVSMRCFLADMFNGAIVKSSQRQTLKLQREVK